MRYVIQHKGTGYIRRRFKLFIYLEFSEEETTIVRERRIQNYHISFAPAYLSSTERWLPLPAFIAAAVVVSGLWWAALTVNTIANYVGYRPPAFIPLFFLWIAPSILGWSLWSRWRHPKHKTADVDLHWLVNNPNVVIHADNPGDMPQVEALMEKRLADLKNFVEHTHVMVQPREVEL